MESIAIGIQCRLSSRRLPAKAMLRFRDTTVLGMCIERAKRTDYPVYVLTSTDVSDDLVELEAKKSGCHQVIRGDRDDVMSRYCMLGKDYGYDLLVRVTADNPLTEFRFIDDLFVLIEKRGSDYVSVRSEFCPKGTSLELFRAESLAKIHDGRASEFSKEHVTTEFIERIDSGDLLSTQACKYFTSLSSNISFTIDTIDDYVFVSRVVRAVTSNDRNCWLNGDFASRCAEYVLSTNNQSIINKTLDFKL